MPLSRSHKEVLYKFPERINEYGFLNDSSLMVPRLIYLGKLASCFAVEPGTKSRVQIANLIKKYSPHENFWQCCLKRTRPTFHTKSGTVKMLYSNLRNDTGSHSSFTYEMLNIVTQKQTVAVAPTQRTWQQKWMSDILLNTCCKNFNHSSNISACTKNKGAYKLSTLHASWLWHILLKTYGCEVLYYV